MKDIKIKVITDYNDGDYITHVYSVSKETLEKFIPLMECIQNFEPYPYKLGIVYSNFYLGELCRKELGVKTPYESYSQFNKKFIDEFINVFLSNNQSEYGIHTIVEISDIVNDVCYIKSEYPEKYQRTNDNIKNFLKEKENVKQEWADLCGCSINEVCSFKFSDMSEEAYSKYLEYDNLWRKYR